MNPSVPASAHHRRFWRWLLLGVGLCLAPFVALALVLASYLTLDRDVAVLRSQVMSATKAEWKTKVQFSLGQTTLKAISAGLGLVHGRDLAEARQALAAVRSASVGVYENNSRAGAWSRPLLFTRTDEVMEKRGWTRLVGVADQKDTVLIYVQRDLPVEGPINVCLAVVNGTELVVSSTSVDASALLQLLEKQSAGKLSGHLNFVKLPL